jgi:hypothetical protein
MDFRPNGLALLQNRGCHRLLENRYRSTEYSVRYRYRLVLEVQPHRHRLFRVLKNVDFHQMQHRVH